ncbi:hypothetical protein ACTVJH_12420 [Desulfoplanes sp. PS50]
MFSKGGNPEKWKESQSIVAHFLSEKAPLGDGAFSVENWRGTMSPALLVPYSEYSVIKNKKIL